jgi:hypothetical protein
MLDYDWLRTAEGLTDYAKAKMENLVVRLTDEKLPFFLEQIVSPVDGCL